MDCTDEFSLKLKDFTREQLIELVKINSKNLMAMDGYWFQSVEKYAGEDVAMEHDCRIWQNFARTEALRIKNFLKLEEHPGLDGLKRAMSIRYNSLLHTTDIIETNDSFTFRILDCCVQVARKKKGLPYHPCLAAGIVEYTTFAQTIDSNIKAEVVSCYPDVNDESCSCAWRFFL